jgi:hypothetical protein
VGHLAPYVAVITLSVLTAHHWRAIRARIINAGIADPLSLTSLHALCDVTETAILENADSEATTKFYDKLYAPEIGKDLNDAGYKPKPSGFDDDEVEASFDAFLQATGG